MKSRFVLAALSTLFIFNLVPTHAFAMDGSNGCGPGWYILKDESLVSSALRSTTNGLLFPVYTFGMTSGTSNCTQHKIVLKEKESLYFATMNHYELKSDAARGNGEYLAAFATTIGCPSSAQVRFNSQMKNNFGKIYSSAPSASDSKAVKPEAVLLEVYKTILADPELTNKCSLGAA